MFCWLKKLRNASRETKNFVLTVIILFLIVVLVPAYCYWRLDKARSGNPKQETRTESRK